MEFEINSPYQATGDQPEAIKTLSDGIRQGVPFQTLLGVTGSGKTFTIANVIKEVQKPTLVISHNKTLAAQLFSEFKNFFPQNAVEYFVSYYDYYQPEAYIASTDTYIEKDMAINEEIERLRLKTTASLLSGRRDIIVVASVSCLYGMADPRAFSERIISLYEGQNIERGDLMRCLADAFYTHSKEEFTSGTFRVKGDTIDLFPAVEGYDGIAYRIELWDDEIDRISVISPQTGETKERLERLDIHPANLFVTTPDQTKRALQEIEKDLAKRVQSLEELGKKYEATRLQERVRLDVEMIRSIGYCRGIENYSRYFDGREEGSRPFCLFDYFPEDFLLVIDESHVSIPQIKAMYGGDKVRKASLVDYGFRLPAAMDNRPLTFAEFETLTPQTIYISATPAEYELQKSEGYFIPQIIRPTGLLDPIIEVRPTENQIDDLLEEIHCRKEKKERVLITTLTKKMAEELSEYLQRMGIATAYLHSDVDTLDRVRILEELRKGVFDVLVGVNLLREGLDLPEVSLVAILDADKEGFLRDHRSLTQTVGRAARNVNGKVLFYADKITISMQRTMDDTAQRRAKQMAYNKEHNIIPRQIRKENLSWVGESSSSLEQEIVIQDPILDKSSIKELQKHYDLTRKHMYVAAKEMNFVEAARLRDEASRIQERIEMLKKKGTKK